MATSIWLEVCLSVRLLACGPSETERSLQKLNLGINQIILAETTSLEHETD